MIYVNYITDENLPSPPLYLNIEGNKLKCSMVEHGTFYKELLPHDFYYVVYRTTKKEDVVDDGCFENIFFGDKKIRIISKNELRKLYNIRNYTELKGKFNSESCAKKLIFICTGFLNISENVLDAVMCIHGTLDNISLKTSYDVLYKEYPDDTSFVDASYEALLTNSYSLTIDGVEYKVGYDENCDGVALPYKQKYSLKLQKYDYNFSDKMNRSADNDIVYVNIETSSVKEYNVPLEEGSGVLDFDLDDYKGDVVIKVRYASLYEKDSTQDYKFTIV